MIQQCKTARPAWLGFCTLVIMCSFFPAACTKQNTHREDLGESFTSQFDEEVKWLVEDRGFLYFPAEALGEAPLSIEVQGFFKDAALKQHLVACHARLRDVYELSGKIVAEFGCTTGKHGIFSPSNVVFRLDATDDQANQLLKFWHSEDLPRELRGVIDAHVMVVMRVDKLLPAKTLGVSGTSEAHEYTQFDEVELIGYGKLEGIFQSEKGGTAIEE